MKNILETGSKVLGWIVILAVFSSLGFLTDNPNTMVPVYLIFFLLLFAALFGVNYYRLVNNKQLINAGLGKKKQSSFASLKPSVLKYVSIRGTILVIAALFVPSWAFRQVGFTASIHVLLVVTTLILIALSIFAIILINRRKLTLVSAGYLILVIVCSFPALLMIQHDRSYHALGLAYYVALIQVVLAWFGITLVHRNYLRSKENA